MAARSVHLEGKGANHVFEHRSRTSCSSERGRLAPHSGAYLAELGRLNYAARTIERHKCAVPEARSAGGQGKKLRSLVAFEAVDGALVRRDIGSAQPRHDAQPLIRSARYLDTHGFDRVTYV